MDKQLRLFSWLKAVFEEVKISLLNSCQLVHHHVPLSNVYLIWVYTPLSDTPKSPWIERWNMVETCVHPYVSRSNHFKTLVFLGKTAIFYWNPLVSWWNPPFFLVFPSLRNRPVRTNGAPAPQPWGGLQRPRAAEPGAVPRRPPRGQHHGGLGRGRSDDGPRFLITKPGNS